MIRKEFDELKNSGRLPSPSGVGLKILDLTQAEDWSVDELVETVSADPALTGRIIKLANSAGIGSRSEISNLADAAMRLGARAVSNQALGFTLVAGNRAGSCRAFDYDRFWSESLARAVAAQVIAGRMQRSSPIEAFTCALLARIGELALASVHGTAYSELLDEFNEGAGLDLRELEGERFAIDSREVSMAMIADWGMPVAFIEAIGHYELEHGEEQVSDSRASELVKLLRMAVTIAGFCLADEFEAVQHWGAMQRVREELHIDAEEFDDLCRKVTADWAEWGELLDVATCELHDLRDVENRAERQRASDERRAADDAGAELPERRLRVLAVDDEPISLKLLERHIKSAGHYVFTAKDGREALELTLRYNPHIVISDWMMPEMDGIDLCKALRRARAGRDVYFLLCTGRDEEDKVVQAFEAGIDDYVVKPFNPKILMARVRAGLRLVVMREQVEHEQRIQSEQTAALGVMARKLRDAASTDPLTELPNRRYGMQRLAEEWGDWERERQPMSVIMADIDHFKSVNDTYGHDVGDEVLKGVAHVMRDSLRAGDVCARIGGEEFLVICPNTDRQGALECAERIRAEVEGHVVKFGDFDGSVTLSMGVATIHPGIESVDRLLKLADKAVYDAKHGGRNRICLADSGPEPLPRSA